MLDARTRNWSDALLEKIGISREILPEIVEPGTVLGELTDEIVEETGMKKVPVIAVGCHDTASAVCAAPLESENSVFISSGTWSLMGLEVREPIITEKSLQYNFTNEGGVEGTIRFLKNISGLWIIQNLKKKWEEKQPDVSYMLIENEARSAERRHFIIDPDDARFMAPMNMVKEVQNYCEEQGQGRPETIGEIALAVYNGLAEKYRQNVVDIEEITGKTVDVINIVGGGTKDRLLCAMTAASTGKAVKVGPVEAAVLGNVLMQMKALGQLKDVAEGREIIKRSFPIETFN